MDLRAVVGLGVEWRIDVDEVYLAAQRWERCFFVACEKRLHHEQVVAVNKTVDPRSEIRGPAFEESLAHETKPVAVIIGRYSRHAALEKTIDIFRGQHEFVRLEAHANALRKPLQNAARLAPAFFEYLRQFPYQAFRWHVSFLSARRRSRNEEKESGTHPLRLIL